MSLKKLKNQFKTMMKTSYSQTFKNKSLSALQRKKSASHHQSLLEKTTKILSKKTLSLNRVKNTSAITLVAFATILSSPVVFT